MTEERGITNLAKAIDFCDARLVLCGKFSSEEYKDYVLGLSEKIDYLGQLDHDALLRVYRSCDVGMCTLEKVGQYAKADTLATKIYEYMMAEIPAVITDTSYNCQIMDKYQFGTCVDPTDIDMVAKAIQRFIDDPVQAYIYGQNGRRAVEQEFNWGVEEKKLVNLYAQIVCKC